MNKLLVGLFTVLALSTTASPVAHAADAYKDPTTVTRVHVYGDNILFQLASGQGGACSSGDSSFGIVPIGTGFSTALQQHQVLLSALLSGRTVRVKLKDCWNGYPKLDYIAIY